MAKAKKRIAARKKALKRGKASVKPARKKAAKRAMPKKRPPKTVAKRHQGKRQREAMPVIEDTIIADPDYVAAAKKARNSFCSRQRA